MLIKWFYHWMNNMRILIFAYPAHWFNMILPKCVCSPDSSNWSNPITTENSSFSKTRKVCHVTCLVHGTDRLFNDGKLYKDGDNLIWSPSYVMSENEQRDVLEAWTEEDRLEKESNNVVFNFTPNSRDSDILGLN